jgi:ABC-type multidrug transport system ATPase subunit
VTAVLAAGLGVRAGHGWAVRAASVRLLVPESGSSALGIWSRRPAASAALIDVLAGHAAPSYGELRVLGQDMSSPGERAAVRHRVGLARPARAQPAFRVRGLIEHAARSRPRCRSDRQLMVAAILDRLALTGWADVPLRAAPPGVCRLARLAAAAVHEPSLLLIDGMLDDLAPDDADALAAAIRELERDTAVIAAGRDPASLRMACDEVLELANGVVVGEWPPRPRSEAEEPVTAASR